MPVFEKLPADLWQDQKLCLPKDLWEHYRDELVANGLLDQAKRGTKKSQIFGGKSLQDTHDHFAWRFAISCTRVQAVVLDPEARFQSIPDEVLATFSSHRVALLDLPCGTGASSLALLCLLAELRDGKLIPQFPLEVRILGVDFSSTARTIFESLVQRLQPALRRRGITVTVATKDCDLTRSDLVSQMCDDWSRTAGDVNEWVVLATNMSGAGNSFIESTRDSFQHIADRLSARKGLILFLEPADSGPVEFLKRLVKQVRFWRRESDGLAWANFRWRHLLVESDLSGGVLVRRFAKDNEDV